MQPTRCIAIVGCEPRSLTSDRFLLFRFHRLTRRIIDAFAVDARPTRQL